MRGSYQNLSNVWHVHSVFMASGQIVYGILLFLLFFHVMSVADGGPIVRGGEGLSHRRGGRPARHSFPGPLGQSSRDERSLAMHTSTKALRYIVNKNGGMLAIHTNGSVYGITGYYPEMALMTVETLSTGVYPSPVLDVSNKPKNIVVAIKGVKSGRYLCLGQKKRKSGKRRRRKGWRSMNQEEFKENKLKCSFNMNLLPNQYMTICTSEGNPKQTFSAKRKFKPRCIAINKRKKVGTISESRAKNKHDSLFLHLPQPTTETTMFPEFTPDTKSLSTNTDSPTTQKMARKDRPKKKDRRKGSRSSSKGDKGCTSLFQPTCNNKKHRRRSKQRGKSLFRVPRS